MNMVIPDFPAPPSGIEKLASLFKHTTTSYKYLWVLAILDEFATGLPKELNQYHTLRFAKLGKRMLKRTHLYSHHYKLKLGYEDKLGTYLENVLRDCGKELGKANANFDIDNYRDFWSGVTLNNSSTQLKKMMNYVPRRLLVPFLPGNQTGATHATIDAEFGHGWQERRNPPLYFYDYRKMEIYIPAQWCRYFVDHYAILVEWVLRKLTCYLEVRNAGVPSIGLKLAALGRGSMLKQRQFWQEVRTSHPQQLKCPYSGKILTGEHVIDHFIPHSFIHHDQPWNLVPTTMQANSAKSDRLPSLPKYMDNFLDMQQLAIEVLVLTPGNGYKSFIQAYEYDVFADEPLSDVAQHPNHVRTKLRKLIKRNHDMAVSQGYPTWQPSDMISFK